MMSGSEIPHCGGLYTNNSVSMCARGSEIITGGNSIRGSVT